MTEEHDKPLDHFFRAAYAELAEEEFTSRLMNHVHRYERRSAVYRNVICLAGLVIAWLLAPYIQSASLLISMFPEATLSLANEPVSFAPSSLLFIFGLAGMGYFLLSSES